MNSFIFYNPVKIYFGLNSFEKIGSEIKSYGIKKIMFLYGKGSIFKNGAYEAATASLKNHSIEFIEYGGIKPNPILSKVIEAAEICKRENIEGILAIGGGSVVDSAKAIGAQSKVEWNIWEAFEGKRKASESLPIFVGLTLSATGSEMNQWAVITNEKENKKWSFTAGHASFPKASFLDPKYQYSLPKEQTIYGAIDALSHIFELYFDPSEGTEIQDELSEGISRVIMNNVKILINKPDDYEARSQLIWSATLALNGILTAGKTYGDWATHEIEHSLSAFYDIAHGAGLAIVFPAWMKYIASEFPDKFARFGEKVFQIQGNDKFEKANAMIDKLLNFYKEIGAPTTLREVNISESEIEKLAENAAIKAPIGNRKKLYKEDIIKILKLAL